MTRCSQRSRCEKTAQRLRDRYGLSEEELAIAALLLCGRSNAHIARILETDGDEVAEAVGRILEKMTGCGSGRENS